MHQVTFEEIKTFTLEELWDLSSEVTERTALAHDFGIAGHDGKEFMENYAARFGVSVNGFDWVAYFGSEGVGPGLPFGLVAYCWRRYVKGIPARDLVDLPEITLGHLLQCAKGGMWQPPTAKQR